MAGNPTDKIHRERAVSLPLFDSSLAASFLELWKTCDLPAGLEEVALAPTVRTDTGEEVPRTSSVSRRYCRFLYALVLLTKPQRVLEVGLANGTSAAFIASALKTYQPEASEVHVAIDPFQASQWKSAGVQTLRSVGVDGLVRLIEELSYRAIPQLEAEGERFDLVFLDGNHCLDYVLSDVMTSDRVLNVGGLLVLDDSNDFGVEMAVSYLDKHRPNLQRVRFDNPLFHWLREGVIGRRRLSVYQKVGEDERGGASR